MSHSEKPMSMLAWAAGTLVPTVLGGLFGLAYALAAWDDSFLVRLIGGTLMGAVPALIIGFSMGWHAAALAPSESRAESAAIWGIVPGVVEGASLGPVLGGTVGGLFGHLVDGILVGSFGLLAGPLAWEIAFFGDSALQLVLKASHSRH